MKRNKEKIPGFDEIIFENRNKEYGAYDLRKKYDKTECISIFLGVFLFSGLVLLITLTTEKEGTAKGDGTIVIVRPDPFVAELDKIALPEPPKPQPVQANLKYQPPVIVEDDAANSASFAAISQIIDSIKDGNVNEKLVVVNTIDSIVPLSSEPLVWVEEMPNFPGGNEALMHYMSTSIKYPEQAIENQIQGMVVVRFVVAENGNIERTEILRSVHPVLDQEAERVVKNMPRWNPGKQNGVAVPVWFSVPVRFRLGSR